VFIDEVKIYVKAGDGGNGCLAFRREKYVPRGGPSGGDGGRGGAVYLVASPHQNTLLHFRFNPEHKAERGRHGEGSNRTGHEGKSIDVMTPVGTVVYDADTGEKLHDFTAPGERFLVARGGRGGRGNARFATSRPPRPGAAAPPGAETPRRRRSGWISQRWKVDTDLTSVRRTPQDRRLPLHHSRAAARRRAAR
jgi:GTP-binding protein